MEGAHILLILNAAFFSPDMMNGEIGGCIVLGQG
jgi:hypothetical protein